MPTWPVALAAGPQPELNTIIRRNKHSRGPRWIRAEYSGRCHCGRQIKPGDPALYFPVRKHLSCRACGRLDVMRISADDLIAILKRR